MGLPPRVTKDQAKLELDAIWVGAKYWPAKFFILGIIELQVVTRKITVAIVEEAPISRDDTLRITADGE